MYSLANYAWKVLQTRGWYWCTLMVSTSLSFHQKTWYDITSSETCLSSFMSVLWHSRLIGLGH